MTHAMFNDRGRKRVESWKGIYMETSIASQPPQAFLLIDPDAGAS